MITDTIANPVISIFSGLFDNIKNIASSITDASSTGLDSYTDQTIETQESTDLLTDTIDSVTDALSEETSEIIDNIASQEELADATRNGADEVDDLGNSSRGAAIATRLLKTAISTLTTVLVSMAISAVVEYLYDLAHAEERIAEKADEAKNNIDKLNSEFENQKKVVNEAIKSYDDLAKGVDSVTNKNVSLSTEDYEKYLDINNQLLDIFPELYDGLDKDGNAILNLGKNGKTAAEELKKLIEIKKEYNSLEIRDQVPDLLAGLAQDKNNLDEFSEENNEIKNRSKRIINLFDAVSNESDSFISEGFSYDNKNLDKQEKKVLDALINSYKEFYDTLNEKEKESLKFLDNPVDVVLDENNNISEQQFASIEKLTEEQRERFFSIVRENFNKEDIVDILNEASQNLKDALMEYDSKNSDLQAGWNNFVSVLLQGLETDYSFESIDDSNLKESIRNIISNLSSNLLSDEEFKIDPYLWIDKNIINPILNLENSEDREKVIQAYTNLLSFDVDESNMSAEKAQEYIDSLINIIAEILNRDPIELKMELGFDDALIDQELQKESEKIQKRFINNASYNMAQRLVNSPTGEQDLQNYQSNLENEIYKIKNSKSINTDEEIDAWNKALEEAIEKQEDLNYATEKYDELIKGIKPENSLQENDDLSFGETITQLDTMTSKFDQLDESYSKLVDGDKDTNIDFTDYTAIQEAFEGVDGIEEYIEKLQEVNGNAEETQKVFDDMATALVDQMDIADILNEKNAGLIAEYLELKGVVNGSEIVYAQLEAQQMANTLAIDNQKIATLDGVKAIYSQIDGLLNQTEATGITTTATYQLIAAQTVFDNTSLNTGQKIQALEELAKSFGITADAADLSAEKAKMMGDITTAMMDGADAAEIEKIMSSYLSTAGSKYEDAIAAKFGNLSASYGGGANSRKAANDAAKQKEETKEEIDWIERYLDKLQERRDQLSQKADSSFLDYLGISQEDLERARELLSSAITPDSDALNELSEIAQRAGMSIKELQDMIFSGAEASGRQSYLTQVLEADRIRLNANTIAVEKYRAEYLKLAEKLPEDIRNKIESNVSLEELGIEEYSSEQAEEINKAMDAYDLLKDKEAERNEIKEDGINSIIAYYQNELDYIDAQNEAIENSNSLIESQMNYLKESGQIISAGMYEQLISNSDRLIDLANDRIKTSKEELEDLLSDPDFNIEEDSETYYEIKNTIAETENEIWGLREAQEAYNNELLQMPINNMDIILNMYQSMTSEIENWGSVWEASGKTLDQTYYQTLIKNGMEIIDQYKEQADLVIDIMDEYEKGSDQWNDLYDKLSNINSEITSIVENMYAWNEALLQLPLDNLDKYLNNLQQVSDAITNVISEYDTVITAVTTLIQNEIDAVNEEKDAVNEAYQDRIDALQDQLDLLEKQNEEKNLQLALEQAQYELEQLRLQKTNRVIRDGRVQYEVDNDAIRDAQEAVQDAEYNITKYKLQEAIDALEEELDNINEAYDDQIDKLQDISDKWAEIKTNIEEANNASIANDYLGKGWEDKVLSGDDQEIYNMFKNMYQHMNDTKLQYDEQIQNTQDIAELLNSYIESYKDGTITYQEAMNGMNNLLSKINDKMTALDSLDNVLDYIGTSQDVTGNTQDILDSIKNSLTQTADELLKSFEVYNENSGLITEYTTSWEQLTDNVASIKDILGEVRDNLEDALDELSSIRDEAEDSDDDDDDSPHWDDSDAEHGPGIGLSYAKGIENGLVGSNNNGDREAKLKLMGLRELDEDEVKAILHKGEAVFNPEQQSKLLSNFETAYNAAIPKISMPTIPELKTFNPANTITITVGDINLPDVTDVDGFAKAMGSRFGTLLNQEIGRNIK